MKVHLRYFAWVRETIGVDEEVITIGTAGDGAELKDVLAALGERSAGHQSVLARGKKLRFALNQKFVESDNVAIADGDELAIFPPVTGG